MKRYEIGAYDVVAGTQSVVEIHDSEFTGTAETMKGHAQGGAPILYTKQSLNPRTRQDSPILKTELQIDIHIETSAHRQLLDDIIDSDEDRFTLIYKIGGTEEWRGNVLPDLTKWPEDSAPYLHVQLFAKDFTSLSTVNFPDEDETETIITTVAECLSQTGISNDIVTYTSWTEDNIASSQDFLNQIYHRTRQLIDLNKNEDTTKRNQITYEEALKRVLLNYALICTQGGGKWHIWQESAFKTPTSVVKSTYNSSGVLQSTSTTDISHAPNNITIASQNEVTPGLKTVENQFLHRSQTFIPRLPSVISLGEGETNASSFNITYTGEEVITISGFVTAEDTVPASGGEFRVQVKAGQYYWNGSSWITGTASPNTYYLTGGGLQNSDGVYVYTGALNITTTKVPANATSPLAITFYSANVNTDPKTAADSTTFQTLSLDITNLSIGDANKESIDFELTQSDSYSVEYTHPKTYFGDGPAVTSASALQYNSVAGNITFNSWGRRDTTGSVGFHDNLLQELMDTNRKSRQLLNASIRDGYTFSPLISYDSSYFLNIGGSYNPYSSTWNPQLLRTVVDNQTDATGSKGDDSDRPTVGIAVPFPDRLLPNALSVIGVTTESVMRENVTEIGVRLDTPVRSGYEYWIINESEASPLDRLAGVYPILPLEVGGVTTEYGPGQITLDIDEQFINAPAGSYIYKGPQQEEISGNFPDFSFVDDTLEVASDTLKASMDLIAQGVNFAKIDADNVNLVTGSILLAEVEGDLDDISNGSNFAKVKATAISAGEILLVEAVGDLDDLADGTNFQKVSSTQLTAGGIVLLSVVSGDLDDVDNGTNFGKVNIINIDAATGKITLVEALGDLDDISDGSSYSRILATEVSAGHIKIAGPDGQTVIDQGEISTDAIFASSATITDVLTMGSGGEITNTGSDFNISSDGLKLLEGTGGAAGVSFWNSYGDASENARLLVTNSGSERIFRFTADDSSGTLQNVLSVGGDSVDIDADLNLPANVNRSGNVTFDSTGDFNIEANDDLYLLATGGALNPLRLRTTGAAPVILETDGGGDIRLDASGGTGEIQIRANSSEGLNISGIPTTNPGGSGNVWNDGGTLKIT